MKCLLIAILLLFSAEISLADEQKRVFCADGYKFGIESMDEESCKKECFVSCSLNDLLSRGWKIESKKSKEITKVPWKNYLLFKSGCTCQGTQYVLLKVEVLK
jgi:hypothetical protein